ncbi:MAG: DUF58 domain-containing protein [Victivallales bacterium]|nr:DUF58 domain-containing protein [Victivallales bacterium]
MEPTLSELLSPALLSRIGDFSLMARIAVEGFLTGAHRSVCRGYGGEFLQYRGYVPGDDLKYVDWKLFARQDKVCMKVFQEETNMRVALVLDASASMSYKGENAVCSKFEYASLLAACLAYLAQRQGDQVGLFVYSNNMLSQTSSSQHHGTLTSMLAELSRIKPSGVADHPTAWSQAADYLKGRGMMVFMSDFHAFEDQLAKHLRMMRFGHRDTMLFHILDHDEISFPFTEAMNFTDSETNDRMATSPPQIADDYRRRMTQFIDSIRSDCMETQTDHLLADTSRSLEDALSAFLNHRKA